MTNTILIVDDEEDIRDLVSDILSDEGFECYTASNSKEAFTQIEKNKPTIILLDIWLQGSDLDGLGILEVANEKYPFIPVIMISGHGTIETAVSAIKMGAYDYLEKPFTPDRLNIIVKRALETSKLKRENLELRKKISTKPELVGNSPAITNLRLNIDRIAPTSSRVLIKGEYGTGKELVAKLIHKLSEKKNNPFVTINSAIINNPKITRDFLGDPSEKKFGIADLAANGTLYIDNITKMPLDLQKNLLKFIQGNKEAQSAAKYNIRIISSISEKPKDAIEDGRLIKDLLSRLNVVNVEVPSLRERKEDIEILCKYFMKNIEKTEGVSQVTIGNDVIALLQSHSWPGNLRELRNVLEKIFITVNINKLDTITSNILNEDLKQTIGKNNLEDSEKKIDIDYMSMSLRQAREEFERQYLAAQMARFNNNISKTSIFVGMERSALHRKLKMLSIHGNSSDEE